MIRLGFFYLLLLLAVWLCLAAPVALAGDNVFDQPVLHPAIPLLDENGSHVLDSNKPYSSRMSCGNGEGGGCHDVDKISKAYHFEMGRDESEDSYGKKRGLAQIISPGFFGGFNCGYNEGQINNPQWLSKKANATEADFQDYGAAGLIKNCAQCHNGGGFAEKDRNGNRYDQMNANEVAALDGDYYEWLTGEGSTISGTQLSRWDWKKSGVIEPDCLMCHADFSKFTRPVSEWDDLRNRELIGQGHFRSANSAILAFLNVTPDSPQGQTLLTVPGGNNASGQPVLQWNADAFDSNGKVKLPMLRFPADSNCMLCHKTSHERRGFYGFGDVAKSENNPDGTLVVDPKDDVHKGKTWTENGQTRSIENCNACHSKQYYKELYKNVDLDADHNFLVGNSEEDVRKDLNFQPGPLSCEHCHNGPQFGGAPNPALPSGHSNILDGHRELWKANGNMVGYPANTLDKVTQVHFDVLACQSCHISKLAVDGQDLVIRYRYRKSEDGKLKMMPYQPSTRNYWMDQTNGRVITRQEYLSVNPDDTKPQSYADVMALKAGFEVLLSTKGYLSPKVQWVWTESNDYLISHNTRTAVSAVPCTGCHARKSNGSISSLVEPSLLLGSKNIRIVSQMADAQAYARLVTEGVIKLDAPYFSVNKDGKIVEDVDNILYETKINPYTSTLKLNALDIVAGEFRQATKAQTLVVLAADDTGLQAVISPRIGAKMFVFNNANAGNKVSKLSIALEVTAASKTIVPNYRLEAALSDWLTYRLTPPGKKPPKPSVVIKQGSVLTPVFNFQLQDQQHQAVDSLGAAKLLLKLPYTGRATDARKIELYETRLISGNLLAPLQVLPAEYLAVVPGTSVNPGYVLVIVDRLPERIVVVDLKKAKKIPKPK